MQRLTSNITNRNAQQQQQKTQKTIQLKSTRKLCADLNLKKKKTMQEKLEAKACGSGE